MTGRSLFRQTRSAMVLPLVLLVVVLMMTIGVGLIELGAQSRLLAVRDATDVGARSAADAALTDAIFCMNEKLKVKPWNGSTLPQAANAALPNSDATFDYSVAGSAGSYTVHSVGRCGRRTRMLNAILRLRTAFEFAIFTENGFELKNSATVGGYNFGANDSPLQVGTNSTASGAICMKNSALIDGDVVVGPGGDPESVISMASGAQITGSKLVMSDEFELDPVVVPAYLLSAISKGTITNSVTISASGKYDAINLGNSKIVDINRPVELYVVGNINLGNSAQICIDPNGDPNGSLVLYVGGNVTGKNSSLWNNVTQDAKKLMIYGLNTCTGIALYNSGTFYGAVYAPNANVELKNGASVYGAVVARGLDMKNSGAFSYDAALRRATEDDQAVRFVVKRWYEQ